jgi:hypothetical protein
MAVFVPPIGYQEAARIQTRDTAEPNRYLFQPVVGTNELYLQLYKNMTFW